MNNKNINQTDSQGFRTGVWVAHHGNGKIACEDTYEKGVLNGLSKTWSSSGSVCWHEYFEMGSNEGEFVAFDYR